MNVPIGWITGRDSAVEDGQLSIDVGETKLNFEHYTPYSVM